MPTSLAKETFSQRKDSLDVLKCIAAFFVIWIHFGYSQGKAIVLGDWIVRCAVPTFFMITGYYYDSIVEKGKFGKHFRKVFLLTLFASLFYLAVNVIRGAGVNFNRMWLFNVGCFHLWYLVALLCDLLLLFVCDKLGLNKILKCLCPVLLVAFFVIQYNHFPNYYYRNFLFMGLPCIMVVRFLSSTTFEKLMFVKNASILIFIFVCFVGLLIEEYLHRSQIVPTKPEMYVCTIPFVMGVMSCLALRHPQWGRGSIIATIGRRYSAYIYIFHIACAWLLAHFVSPLVLPFATFALSLCMSVAYVFVKSLFSCR